MECRERGGNTVGGFNGLVPKEWNAGRGGIKIDCTELPEVPPGDIETPSGGVEWSAGEGISRLWRTHCRWLGKQCCRPVWVLLFPSRRVCPPPVPVN